MAQFDDRGQGVAPSSKDKVPSIGIASLTCGRVSVTMLWNTVNERRMVTPAMINRKGRKYLERPRLTGPAVLSSDWTELPSN